MSELPAAEPSFDVEDGTRRAAALWAAFLGVWGLTFLHFGAVVPWAVAATTLALALLNGLAILLLPDGIKLSRWSMGWLLAVASVFLLQLLPLGPVLFPVTDGLRHAHGVSTIRPGTADLYLTLRSIAQFGSYVLSALLVIRLRSAGLSPSTMLKGLAGLLALEAGYGVVQYFAGLAEIPFFGPRPTPDAASGTLVNRNTFGGVMAMGSVIAVALAYSRFAWSPRTSVGQRGRTRVESGTFWALIAGLFIFCLVLSKSRGGALGAAAGIVMLPFLFRGKASSAAALGIVLAGAVAVALADPSILVRRFEQLDPFEIQEDTRVKIWVTTLQAAAHQPVLGFGLGTHPHAYHPYQPPALTGQIHHAHNEYVNFLFEGGAVFLLAILGGLVLWAGRSWKALQRLAGPDRFLPTAALCAAAAEVIHSVVDFDCRVTSAGMLFGALVGLAASVVRPKRPPGKAVWAAVSAASAVAALALFVRPLDSDATVDRALQSGPAEATDLMRRALELSPYQFQAAWVLAKSEELQEREDLAAGRYGVAADLWPAHPGLQRDVGLWFWDRWVRTQEKPQYDRAVRSLQRLFIQKPREVAAVMQEIWQESRPLEEYAGLLPPERPAAVASLASFLASKGRWKAAQELFDRSVPAVRENTAAFDLFADALRDAGQWGLEAMLRDRRLEIYTDPRPVAASAEAWARLGAWDRALERASQACRIDPASTEWVILKADLYRQSGHPDKALESYVLAVQQSPLDVGLLFKRAALYSEMAMHGEAAQDYRQILRSKSGDRQAVFGLARALAAANDPRGARRALDEYLGKNPGDAEAAALRARLGQ